MSLPSGERDVRHATADEAEVMDEIIKQDAAGCMPSDVLAAKISQMLA